MNEFTERTATVNDTKVTVKKIPFRCPVCNGFGNLKHGTLVCQGCKGKGYVIVDQDRMDDEERETYENKNNLP